MYSEKVLNIFSNLENYGIVKKPSAKGEYKNETSADVISITILVEDGKITNAKFKAFGNVATLVAAEVACEQLYYKYIVDIKKITASDILSKIGELPPEREDACKNAYLAIKNLIADFEKKEAKKLKQAMNF